MKKGDAIITEDEQHNQLKLEKVPNLKSDWKEPQWYGHCGKQRGNSEKGT